MDDLILSKAKELGLLISQSEEMLTLKTLELEVLQDKKSQQYFSDFNQLQIEMSNAMKENDKEKIDNIKKQILMKHQEINSYEITKKYLNCKAKLDNLIKQVNDIITYVIIGEETELGNNSCCSTSSCKSCTSSCSCENSSK